MGCHSTFLTLSGNISNYFPLMPLSSFTCTVPNLSPLPVIFLLLLLLHSIPPSSSIFSPETNYKPITFGMREYFEAHNISTTGIQGVAVTFTPRITLPFPLVIRTFMDRLPVSWHAIVFTHSEQMDRKRDLVSLLLSGMPDAVTRIHVLPFLIPFSPQMYSCVVLSPEFYRDLPAPWVLLFQMDSLILRRDDNRSDRPPHRYMYLRDFLAYPYWGAPWKFRGCDGVTQDLCRDGGNGGFSLRSRNFMINVTTNPKFVVKRHRKGNCENEDTALSDFMLQVAFSPLPHHLTFSAHISSRFLCSTITKGWLQRDFLHTSPWRPFSRRAHTACTSRGSISQKTLSVLSLNSTHFKRVIDVNVPHISFNFSRTLSQGHLSSPSCTCCIPETHQM
jgi:hypothetical protein